MGASVHYEEERIEVWRRDVKLSVCDTYGVRLLVFRELLEQNFDALFRAARVLFDKVVVVFNHHSIDVKNGVVMLRLVDSNFVLFLQNFIGLNLLAKEPNIKVAAGSMLRNRVGLRQSYTLENH